MLRQVHNHDLTDEFVHGAVGRVGADNKALLGVLEVGATDLDQDALNWARGDQGRLLLLDVIIFVLLTGGHHGDLLDRLDGDGLKLAHGDNPPVGVLVQDEDAKGCKGVVALYL